MRDENIKFFPYKFLRWSIDYGLSYSIVWTLLLRVSFMLHHMLWATFLNINIIQFNDKYPWSPLLHSSFISISNWSEMVEFSSLLNMFRDGSFAGYLGCLARPGSTHWDKYGNIIIGNGMDLETSSKPELDLGYVRNVNFENRPSNIKKIIKTSSHKELFFQTLALKPLCLDSNLSPL